MRVANAVHFPFTPARQLMRAPDAAICPRSYPDIRVDSNTSAAAVG